MASDHVANFKLRLYTKTLDSLKLMGSNAVYGASVMYPLVLVSTIEYYLQYHVMYLLPDDSVPAAAGEHLDPQQEAPVPHRAAPAAAGQD